jgi:hypothetical protein
MLDSSTLASADVTEFQTTDVYSRLTQSRVKYCRYGWLNDEEMVMLQTRLNNSIH